MLIVAFDVETLASRSRNGLKLLVEILDTFGRVSLAAVAILIIVTATLAFALLRFFVIVRCRRFGKFRFRSELILGVGGFDENHFAVALAESAKNGLPAFEAYFRTLTWTKSIRF